jgi:protein SCO1/2
MIKAVQSYLVDEREEPKQFFSSRKFWKRELRSLIFAFCLLPFAFGIGLAQQGPFKDPAKTPIPAKSVPPALKDIGIEQKLDSQVPLDLPFRDEQGKTVQLSEYFGKKPVVLALVYYTCPMLCNQILNGLTGTLKTLNYNVGEEFDVVTVSFDPKEAYETAAAKKLNYLDRYERKGAAREKAATGWHFLTGDETSIKALTQSVGFNYRWDEETQQYIHASGIMVLTPQGKVSRYLYGIEYAPVDLKLSLVDASAGKIGSPVEQLFLFCYHYDPATGKYSLVIMNIIKLASAITFAGIALIVFIFRRRRAARERKFA